MDAGGVDGIQGQSFRSTRKRLAEYHALNGYTQDADRWCGHEDHTEVAAQAQPLMTPGRGRKDNGRSESSLVRENCSN